LSGIERRVDGGVTVEAGIDWCVLPAPVFGRRRRKRKKKL